MADSPVAALAAAGRARPAPYLPPGSMLGNYKLLGGVAAGGFGLTYVARDMALARNVAIKECFPMGICRRNPDTGEILPLSPQLEGAYLKTMGDMRREARFLASLDHERIVRIFEVFESHGSLFYAMPWLPGGSLREKMDEARKTGKAAFCRAAGGGNGFWGRRCACCWQAASCWHGFCMGAALAFPARRGLRTLRLPLRCRPFGRSFCARSASSSVWMAGSARCRSFAISSKPKARLGNRRRSSGGSIRWRLCVRIRRIPICRLGGGKS